MDRRVAKPKWSRGRVLALGAVALLVVLGAVFLRPGEGGASLRVSAERLEIAQVRQGTFEEYIPVVGSLEPVRTVYLDAVEGGRVEAVYVREGALVEEGQPILRLSNNSLQLDLLQADAQNVEQLNLLANMKFEIERNTLQLRQQLAEADHQLERLERKLEQSRALHERQLISRDEYATVEEEHAYWKQRRELMLHTFRQDSLRMERQARDMGEMAGRMRANHGVLRQILDNLTVRAPVSGYLTALDAEVGELRTAGHRFGQIDVRDGYKVLADIDEYHISRVRVGQAGEFQQDGETYRLRVAKIHPEVRDAKFKVELAFDGKSPAEVRRGQTVRVRLTLGDAEPAVLLPQGAFHQTTGGGWVFVLDRSGDRAVRREIRLGRQNPQYFEVLEGLRPGDRVVVSSYDAYRETGTLLID